MGLSATPSWVRFANSKRIRLLLLTKELLQKKLDKLFDQWVHPKCQDMITSLNTLGKLKAPLVTRKVNSEKNRKEKWKENFFGGKYKICLNLIN